MKYHHLEDYHDVDPDQLGAYLKAEKMQEMMEDDAFDEHTRQTQKWTRDTLNRWRKEDGR